MIAGSSIGELPIGALREFRGSTSWQQASRLDFKFRVLAATHEMITAPTDAMPNIPFPGTVQKALRLDRSIISGGGFGQVSSSWGELEIVNTAGDYDSYVDQYLIEGRRVVLKIGRLGSGYDRFRTVFDGTASGWLVDEDVLRVTLRDNSFKLQVPASPNLYEGTGDLAGGEDLKGKRKPVALGYVENVSPPLLIPAELVYQVSDGPVQSVVNAYDRGSALTWSANYSTSPALRAATVPAGNYATCVAEGLFRLGSTPGGEVTADVEGDKTGGVFVSTTGAIIRRLMSRATKVADPAGLIPSTFTALDTAQPAPVGYWLPPDSTETVRDVADALLGGIGAWGDFRRDGLFQVGRIVAPTGAPEARYTDNEILAINRMPLPSDLAPPPWRFRVAWGRNWTVQTDLAGIVSATRKAYLAEQFRTAASSDLATGLRIKAGHPLAQDPQPRQSYFRDLADAQAEADRLLELFSPTRAMYRIRLKLQPFVHELGSLIHVTSTRQRGLKPAWDLGSGRLMRIVAFSEDMDAREIEVTAFG